MPGLPAPLPRGHPGPHAHRVRGAAAEQDGRPHRRAGRRHRGRQQQRPGQAPAEGARQAHQAARRAAPYDEKLRHYADQRIALDLDDGVKVNYGKFGDLLAEVKAVTGK